MKRKVEVSELIFRIIAYVILIIFAIMCIYPFLYAIGGAFSSSAAIDGDSVVLWPMVQNDAGKMVFGFDFKAFTYAATRNQFWISYANTLFVTILGTVWTLVYSILGAYALSKKRLLGRHGWNFFLVFTMWFSAGVVATFYNYQATGKVFANLAGVEESLWRTEVDLKWLVVIAMGMNATNIILLRNAFEGVPSEIEEAARIDGATERQVLMNVFIPMSKATIATVALFFGISRWNGYFWAYRIMGTEQSESWPVQVYIRYFISNYTNLTGEYDAEVARGYDVAANGSATSVVYSLVICAIIPILVIYPFIQKYFAKGVNMGGVKE